MSDFKAKVHQIRFPLGLCPRARWGSLQRSPDLLAAFKRPASKEKEGVKKWGREEEEREERGREEICRTNVKLLPTCLYKRRADFVRRRRVLCNPADGSDDECLHHLCGLPCQIDAVRFLDDGNDTTQSESDRNG